MDWESSADIMLYHTFYNEVLKYGVTIQEAHDRAVEMTQVWKLTFVAPEV